MLSSNKGISHFGDNGETANPFALHDICLNYLCDNLNEICVTKTIIVTPKRRRVNSGANPSYIDEVDSGNHLKLGLYQNTGIMSKLRGASSNSSVTHDEGVGPVVVSPNLKPILPRVSEHYFNADSPDSKHSTCEGKKYEIYWLRQIIREF